MNLFLCPRILAAATLVMVAFFTSCSTAKTRVLPGEDGTNRVVSNDIERDGAEEAAVEAANDYCKDQKKKAVFVKEDTKYTGSTDEGTRNTIRKASKIAKAVGFGQRDYEPDNYGANKNKPGVVETAGEIGEGMTNDRDYKSEVIFKCQ